MLMRTNRILLISVCLLSVQVLFTGCDHIRAILGRPTSAEIAVLKDAMEADIAWKQHVADSIAAAEAAAAKALKDSTDAVQAIDAAGVMSRSPESFGGISKGNMEHRYYIVLGAYKKHYNVEALIKKIDPEFAPSSVRFFNGLEVVLAAPADKIADSWALYQKIKEKDYCPKGAWILDRGE